MYSCLPREGNSVTEEKEEKLSGVVEHITFRNSENGFTVLDLNNSGELVTVVGVLPEVDEGENLNLSGKWGFHPNFGRQFKAELCERSLPKNSADLLRYLSSGAVKGIGPSTALKIVEAFGEDSFDVLENDTDRLSTIKGISKSKALKISKSFKEQFAVREIMISLEKYGMTPNECLKAFKALGNNAVALIEGNPYILCGDGIGIGFERADTIAGNLPGKHFDNMYRIQAGIIYIFRHNLSNGHTCLPEDRISAPAKELLGASEDETMLAIDRLTENGELISYEINERKYLFLPYIFRSERSIAQRIELLKKFPPAGCDTLESDIRKIEYENDIKYAEKQRLAIMTAAQKGILILTGGPGTGKTTTLNGILKIFEKQKLNVALCAPTGRAAKRMSELTGREAKTIHRLLEVEWDKDDRPVFARNIRNPLNINAIIIDELSMVDVVLFSSLLEAVPLGCRIVMVGDSNQLPPVGAGNVLHDMIGSGALPVVTLTEVFRQAMESLIVTNAHKIVKGEEIDLSRKDKDFFMMEKSYPSLTASTVAELCKTRLPAAYGFSPLNDIQVICPSRKGEAGTVNLNRILQEILNPPAPDKKEVNIAGRLLREGDKIMQIKNNYDITWEKGDESGTGVFNGDVGILEKINLSEGTMRVNYDDRISVYPLESAEETELAYAMTVHKSQGNEFEAVILPVFNIPAQLRYRNLLYTAVTRAKKMLIIVGSSSQLRMMAENNKVTRRYSALKAMLDNGI